MSNGTFLGSGAGRNLFATLLDALPASVLLLDQQGQVIYRNARAGEEFSGELPGNGLFGPGLAMQCAWSVRQGFCGGGDHCGDCALRHAVETALTGDRVCRVRTRAVLLRDGKPRRVHLYVTAQPLQVDNRDLVMVTLEDVSELIQLESLIPICASCRKIRDDDAYWKSVEEYFASRLGVEFSHGICEDCRRQYYPASRGGLRTPALRGGAAAD